MESALKVDVLEAQWREGLKDFDLLGEVEAARFEGIYQLGLCVVPTVGVEG